MTTARTIRLPQGPIGPASTAMPATSGWIPLTPIAQAVAASAEPKTTYADNPHWSSIELPLASQSIRSHKFCKAFDRDSSLEVIPLKPRVTPVLYKGAEPARIALASERVDISVIGP